MWVHPSILTSTGWPHQLIASELAITLLGDLPILEPVQPPPTGQELQIHDQRDSHHTLLAFLWATSQKLVPTVSFQDLPNSKQINHQCGPKYARPLVSTLEEEHPPLETTGEPLNQQQANSPH